ncbi:MAG: methyl-accepting chemotaxis protein [Luteibacter sp.]|uniref:methyl-accepting chemotaxis protein n=1 Tax=Luteibacter sp. TaxID=1886636 RepID=UPI002806C83B|nr:methyl-accepting chemotaxis protein [Luteibacter sp.]MDQ7995235.1 methyl-accepting chemotaxis protein [Luteibacter sp.]
MTVRQRITLLIVSAVLIALTVGAAGLLALRQTAQQLDAMYQNALVPIVDVTSIRDLFNENRTGLNRALLKGTAEAAAEEQARDGETVGRMDALWARYYPAMVSSGQERSAADAFLKARDRARAAKAQLEPMMASGRHDEAIAFMLGTVGPAFTEESKAIEAIVKANVDEAAVAYTETQRREKRAILTVSLVVLLGGLALVVAGLFLARSVMRPLVQARELAASISDGELGHTLEVRGKDEVSDTLRSLVAMDATLAGIVRKVRDNAGQVSAAARDIAAGNDELSSRTQEQASSLEETAASMEEMTASVRQNADSAAAARGLAEQLTRQASATRGLAGETSEAMGRVSAASREIGGIVSVIDELAFQTNLLALNAAVEAARAGEQGRGFAVVAGEVRRLAQQSAVAAKDIKGLVASSGERVEEGAVLLERTTAALLEMQGAAVKVASFVTEIATASAQQAAGIDQVNMAVTELDAVTQQNAALVEEASAASQQASELADGLMTQVAVFRFAGDASASIARDAAPAASSMPAPVPRFAPPQSKLAMVEPAWREF